jgi:spermidine/putrescine transport system permease protein
MTNAATSSRNTPNWRSWLMLSPLLLWLAIFVIAPTVILAVYSLCTFDGPAKVKFAFTAEHYQRIFDPVYGPVAWRALWQGAIVGGLFAIVSGIRAAMNQKSIWRAALRRFLLGWAIGALVSMHFGLEALTLIPSPYIKTLWRSVEYATGTTVLCLLIGYPVAYFIGRAGEAWRNRLLMLVMIPFWTSFLIRTYAWITILKQEGLLNALLQSLHLTSGPIDLFYSPFSVTMGLVYNYLPFMILPIYGSVEKLDNSLIEAALDLGASPVRAFSNIVLPLTRPGIVAGVLLVFVPCIGMFAIVDLMGGSRIRTIGSTIQDQFIGQSGNWPFGSALGMTVLAMFALAFLFTAGTKSPEN